MVLLSKMADVVENVILRSGSCSDLVVTVLSHLNWGHRGQCLRHHWDTQQTPPADRRPTVKRGKTRKTHIYIDTNSLSTTSPRKKQPVLHTPSVYFLQHKIHRPPVLQFATNTFAYYGPKRWQAAKQREEERRREERNTESCLKPQGESQLSSPTLLTLPLFFSPLQHLLLFFSPSDIGWC